MVSFPASLRAATVLALLLMFPPVAPPSAREMERFVLEGLQAARRDSGTSELRHRADLDEVARTQAAKIARRPHKKRLQFDEPIEEVLLESGIDDVRRAVVHVDLKRGYERLEMAVLADWKEYGSAWRNAMSKALDSVGLAFGACDDGWVVVVVILVEELDFVRYEAADLQELERETLVAVNEVRKNHGLGELTPDPRLAPVARSHSEEMALLGYFAHRSPRGLDADDRVQRAGLALRCLGENLHKSRGTADPARTAVESWMQSGRHRETLLTPAYTHTAVGVAVDAEGGLFFTQLFLLPGD